MSPSTVPPAIVRRPPSIAYRSTGPALRRYFRSGWAFLIPYLAFYLLYHWRKWPANGFAPSALGNGGTIPALLHVYWALHLLHLALAAIALHAWWNSPSQGSGEGGSSPAPEPLNEPKKNAWPRLYAVFPWLLLALIFAIPGVYLEWPADPWEHLRRITEWGTHATASTHSAGYKSLYFFAYSFVGWLSPARLLSWLNVYYAGMCLLLAWQYYLLAKAVGLNCRWAFLSVIVNVLIFGNVCFSFYRYYGLASTMFAQLGAVALTRIALEVAKQPQALRFTLYALRAAFCAALLLLLIAFNHVQGLGIAGLGLASIAVWRLIAWKRSMIFWLAAAAFVLSVATILWWPRHHMIDTVYRPGGWLNAWYGFNLFTWPSPAADRAMQILGFLGLVNLLAGVIMLWRNNVLGWLTIGPFIGLGLPFVAFPFANLTTISDNTIITYHRMFFAIPSGLALLYGLQQWGARALTRRLLQSHTWGFGCLVLSMAVVVTLPAQRYSHNRFWHLLAVVPEDLQLISHVSAAESAVAHEPDTKRLRWVTTGNIASVLTPIVPRYFPYGERRINQSTTENLDQVIAVILSSRPTENYERPSLTHDPLGSDPLAWTTDGGLLPDFITDIEDFHPGSTALQNLPGRRCNVFTADLIPVDPAQKYRVEFSVTQRASTKATVYLAIAWYDKAGRLLVSSTPTPAGAGSPVGWNNGTYSYFGLVDQMAPTTWTTFRKSFGRDEAAVIPPNAKFVRVGALLNYNAMPGAVVQITNIRLWPKSKAEMVADGTFHSYEHLFIVAPAGRRGWTHASQAAQVSHHWPAQRVAVDLAGGAEIAAAASAAGGTIIDPDSVIFELGENAGSLAPKR